MHTTQGSSKSERAFILVGNAFPASEFAALGQALAARFGVGSELVLVSNFEEASSALASGHHVFFPPLGPGVGAGDMAGLPLFGLNPQFVRASTESGSRVLPVWVDRDKDNPSRILFAEPLGQADVTEAAAREKLLDLWAQSYSARPRLNESLALACLRGLKQKLGSTVLTDAFQGNRRLSGAMTLAIGLALAGWIRKEIQEPRVGVVLPPGAGTMLVNLALVLAGKTPVNLNFTAGVAVNRSAIRQARLKTVFTADAFVAKIGGFPWPDQRFDLSTIIKRIGKARILARLPAIYFLKPDMLADWFGISKEGGDREAAILFTSGSSGEPKGVVLSHRNIVGNALQIQETLSFIQNSKLLACLPTFHSFGFTVTIWWPLCGGPEVVSYVSPLETAKLSSIIQEHSAGFMITTPTFLRGFLKRVQPDSLRSLKWVVVGAEKLPVDLAAAFEEKFQIPVSEGYGITETSPVLGVNLIGHEEWLAAYPGQTTRRPGSIGRPLPGVAVRLTHPETGAPLSLFETGMLWFRGSNIFVGYLDDPVRTSEALRDGWFKSGDMGRMDTDGFLYIEGRLSRFSKIAGEMVPHGTIEEHLHQCFGGAGDDVPLFAIVGRFSPEKGEELVLLSAVELGASSVMEKLRGRGVPNLWIPKHIVRVDKIPLLGSGKLDIRQCRAAAGCLSV